MIIIPYSASRFVNLRMLTDSKASTVKYDAVSINSALRLEMSKDTKLSQIIKTSLNLKQPKIELNILTELWLIVLERFSSSEILFISAGGSYDNYQSLLNATSSKNITCERMFNFLLKPNELKLKSLQSIKNTKHEGTPNESHIISMDQTHEKDRLQFITTLRPLLSIINIDANKDDNLIEQSVITEIKTIYNNM